MTKFEAYKPAKKKKKPYKKREKPPPKPTVAAIYADREAQNENWDSLGISISLAGNDCLRSIWYAYRWLLDPKEWTGQMLRLLETGHIQEDRMIADLRRVVPEVWDHDPKTDKQFAARFLHGHLRGKLDAVVRGMLEAPGEVMVAEMKSHNDSNFKQVQDKGVKKAKYQHWVQIQLYMRFFNIQKGVYFFVNKNTDDLEYEILDYEESEINVLLSNLMSVIKMAEPPARINDDPDSRDCKFCDFSMHCHSSKMPTRRSCRTCLHSTPVLDDHKYPVWHCDRWNRPVDTDGQKVGCQNHLLIPALVPGEQISFDAEAETITYKMFGDDVFVDGKAKDHE